jgi:hypothetical protein
LRQNNVAKWAAPGWFLVVLLLATLTSTAAAHEGGIGNEVMWRACDSKQVNDQCSFQNHAHDIFRGSCQTMVDNMVCVRNQPIEHAATADGATGHNELQPPDEIATGSGRLMAALAILIGATILAIWIRKRQHQK